ncbi:MAG: hypothetical protein E5W21_32235, partial [Mesorhizobium sp.]
FGTDSGLPVPLLISRDDGLLETLTGCAIFASNDQHAYMRVPAKVSVKVGDRIGLGVSHPCTTFDKWQILFLVNDDYDIVGALKTYF